VAQACQCPYSIDKGNKTWTSFKEALRIRDRLTHPKKQEDLIISDNELRAVEKTAQWYKECVRHIMTPISNTLKDMMQKLIKRSKDLRAPH